jgi:hypothetical protein
MECSASLDVMKLRKILNDARHERIGRSNVQVHVAVAVKVHVHEDDNVDDYVNQGQP